MTRQQRTKQAPRHFWSLTPNNRQRLELRLVAAMIDRGESGAVDKTWAYSLDGRRVRLISPFRLTDQEKDKLRASVGRVRHKNLREWAMFVSPGFFDKGIERPDYIRCTTHDPASCEDFRGVA